MPVDFSKRGPSITEAAIDRFQADLGCQLPADYREFLLSHNGGRPEFHVIRTQDVGDLGVQLFYGLWDNENYDIVLANQVMRGRWPRRFIAIAIDDFGNQFCLSLGEPDYGRVYFWNHEEEAEEDEEPTEFNLYPIADSFAEFWELVEAIDKRTYLAEKGIDLDELEAEDD
jgi:cell wall assembly regulator SMI1